MSDFGKWRDMATAPRDGSRVLVEIRPSEQGAAEVDMVRWARPDRSGDECWVSSDSDPACLVTYAETELSGWMPLPNPVPRLRSRRGPDEMGGSGI